MTVRDITITKEEAIERLKQNKAVAEFYAGMVQNTIAIENELKDIEAINMAIKNLSTDRVDVVRCKNCRHRHTYECPMYHEEWHTVDEGDGYFDDDLVIFDWTVDDGYCHLGDTEGDGDE